VLLVLHYKKLSVDALLIFDEIITYINAVEKSGGIGLGEICTLYLVGAKIAEESGDHLKAISNLRFLLTIHPRSNYLINNVYTNMCKGKISLDLRWMKRFLKKNPGLIGPLLIQGNQALAFHWSSSSYVAYLQAYIRLKQYEQDADADPDQSVTQQDKALVTLCLAVAYIDHIMNKVNPDRHTTFLRALAFFTEYAAIRGHPAESTFNLGRACHQLGLLDLSVALYEKVLAMEDDPHEIKKDAAYNLHLIYKSSGNGELANKILLDYLVV